MHSTPPFLRGGNLRQSLGGTLTDLLAQVPPAERAALDRAVQAEGFARGLYYEDPDGRPVPTPILLRPRVLGGNQRAYLHEVTLTLERAYLKLYRLWRTEPAVRALLPVTELEARWLHDLFVPDRDEVLFGRFDATTDFGAPDWAQGTRFFEFNPVGAGGTFLAPTVDEVVLRHVVPVLRRYAPTLVVETNDDPRKVLLEVLADHARALGLRRFNVALVQAKDMPGGVNEFPANVEYLRSLGLACWHVDPRELSRRGEQLFYGDVPIDLVYRDHEVSDLSAREAAGEDVSALKWALMAGRAVSSLAGELDQKSAFQVFTSRAFEGAFTEAERRVFRKHVPWTRIVADGRTECPEGESVELLPYLRKDRERCVLKPNRGYGGEGILIGPQASTSAWDAALERAVREPDAWVVQGYRPVAEKDFPQIDADGHLTRAEYFTVLGLFASTQRLGILGRASRRKVVNVAQKGGLVAVLRLL